MNYSVKTTSAIFAGLLLASVSAFAHHKFSSEFDANKAVTLSGKITKVDWKEPHVEFKVQDQATSHEWTVEGASPATLRTHGWANTSMKEGDTISVHGFRATDGSYSASARSVTMADGKEVSISDSAEDGGPKPATTASANFSGSQTRK